MKKQAITLLLCILFTNYGQAKEVSIEEKITGLYVAYFKRASDQNGLEFWKKRAHQVNNNSTALKELSAGFAEHNSFTTTYAYLDNQAFVETIYKNVLGEAGDEEGIESWRTLLDNGMSRSDMVSEFIEASLTLELTQANFPNLTVQELEKAQLRQDLIHNKVEVARHFTSTLANHTNIADNASPENDPAYVASKNIIVNITVNYITVSNTINFINGIKDKENPIEEINNDTPSVTPTTEDTHPNYTTAKTNGLEEVSITFNGLNVVVTTNTPMTAVSPTTIAIYGNIKSNSTKAQLKLNSNYPNGTKFVVKVYENSELVGISEELTSGGTSINFNDIL